MEIAKVSRSGGARDLECWELGELEGQIVVKMGKIFEKRR